jgi:protein SCO1/2
MVPLVLAAFAFAVFQPVQVLPRIRLAPGFTFVDQSGAAFTSDAARGQVVLYGFAYGDCGAECESVRETMAEITARADAEIDLGDTELRLVTVSFDPVSDRDRLPELAEEWGADGEAWRWATGDNPELLRTVLTSGFELYHQQLADGSFAFDSRFVLVDGWGVVRGEYRYSTLADDADKIVRHIGLLGDELRNSNGVRSIAYEAAHIFMCYP